MSWFDDVAVHRIAEGAFIIIMSSEADTAVAAMLPPPFWRAYPLETTRYWVPGTKSSALYHVWTLELVTVMVYCADAP